MRKKNKTSGPANDAAGFENLPDHVDFYSSGVSEQPLSGGNSRGHAGQIRKTGRHEGTRASPNVDIREKMALISVLKTLFMILLLMIAFVMLWKGIKIYEESVWLEARVEQEASPVLQQVSMVPDFDLAATGGQEQFAERIEIWKEAERLIASSRTLLQRNNYDEAIIRCQEALRLDPAHQEALELLGELYFAKEMNVEAANAYIRLLSVDPSDQKVQKRLIESLDRVGDHEAVRYMAEWYLDQNLYDTDVQRFLANALFKGESYEEAAAAFDRVLQEEAGDINSMELQAAAYMRIGQYKAALEPLQTLRQYNYRVPAYYRQLALSHAQLGQSYEAVQVLGRATQIFGDKLVMGWMQDTHLDPVREDRIFQSFLDHLGGEGFRQWLDKMSQNIDEAGFDTSEINPMLKMPVQEERGREKDLLRERRESSP